LKTDSGKGLELIASIKKRSHFIQDESAQSREEMVMTMFEGIRKSPVLAVPA
jgi:hypothetical protein